MGSTSGGASPNARIQNWIRIVSKKIVLADKYIILGFLIFAAFYQLSLWYYHSPHLLLGDSANIAGIAAAREYPQLFKGDELLGDLDNVGFYKTVHFPFIQLITRATKSYGLTFNLFVGIHVFVQMVGFYILGRVFYRDQFWAVLLALLALVYFKFGLGEFWGITNYVIPRFTFQTLLPYQLAAAYYWRSSPRVWPWLMISAGLLMYVHPVSAPAWGFAIWLGLWIFHPYEWSLLKRVSVMLCLGILFLAVTASFIVNFISHHAPLMTPDYDRVYHIAEYRFIKGFFDIRQSLADYLRQLTKQPIAVLVILACLIVPFGYIRTDRRRFLLVGIWIIGLLVVSGLIPWLEQTVAKVYRVMPPGVDLLRGLRYILPLIMILALWLLREIAEMTKRPVITGIVGIALFVYVSQSADFFSRLYPIAGMVKGCCLGKFSGISDKEKRELNVLRAVRRLTPPGAAILSTKLGLQIRYFALRPIVYCRRDGDAFIYSDHAELVRWYERDREMKAAFGIKNGREKTEKLIAMGKKYGADYLLVDYPLTRQQCVSLPADPVYRKHGYTLLQVTE
ncbi:MAG: hypothetical protein ABIJ27_04645 [Candidatus Omnitrophota bacterium]